MSVNKKTGIFIAALLLPLALWTIEALVESMLLKNQGFFGSWIQPTPVALKTRILTIIFFGLGYWIFLLGWQKVFRPGTKSVDRSDQFSILMDAYPDCIVVHRNNRVLFANQNTLDFFQVTNFKQFQGASIMDFVDPRFQDILIKRQEQIRQSDGPSDRVEIPIIMLDKSTRNVSLSSTAIDIEGEPAMLSFFRDITEQVTIGKELLNSRERLQLALEASQAGVWDWDITTGQMVYSRAWAEMLGFKLEDLQPDQSTWLSIIHPEDHARSHTLLQAHLRGEIPQYESEVRLRHQDGHFIWIFDRGRVVAWDDEGNPLRMTGTHRNITARKEAELALEIRNRITETFLIESDQDKYQLLLETIIQGTGCGHGFFATLDGNLNLKVWSVYPQDSSQLSAIQGLKISYQDLPAFIKPVIDEKKSIILDQPHRMGELGLEFKTSLAVPITNRKSVIGVIMLGNKGLGFFESDRSLMVSLADYLAPLLESHMTSEMRELQLRQAQKMEALGALAGGIAHDFNNILQAIMGFSSLAKDDAPRQGTISNDLEKVLKAARRGQDLVQRILLFSRREEQEQHPVSINLIASEAVELLKPAIPTTIEIRSFLDEDCGLVMGDPAQINQMIMNLATNAFHAMEDDGGILEIGLRLFETDEDEIVIPASLKDRKVVMMWVADNGCGIDQEEMDRVFDPFFTTKEVGRGTGLGLSVVHGIVTNHGGEIQLESNPGRGTTIRIFLPAQPDTQENEAQDTLSAANIPANTHIMFVDDEEDIATMGQTMLEKQGFKVTAFSDSPRALEEIRKQKDDYDLVITDLTMPQLTGLQLADGVAEIRKDLPVILVTGRRDDGDMQLARRPQIKGVVHKPFSLETLFQTITSVLRENSNGAT
jgi:PAS domain S-box-containing protein